MAKKVREMTSYESSLYSDLKKLAKRANQRIVRLERLTEKQETFATKQLADLLSIEGINAWTKKGRVKVNMSMDVITMRATIKAVKQFLNNPLSRVKPVTQFKKTQEKEIGKKISYKKASAIYLSRRDWRWILQYFDESEFWAFARESIVENWSEEQFIENILPYINSSQLDEYIKEDLKNLYEYSKGVKR